MQKEKIFDWCQWVEITLFGVVILTALIFALLVYCGITASVVLEFVSFVFLAFSFVSTLYPIYFIVKLTVLFACKLYTYKRRNIRVIVALLLFICAIFSGVLIFATAVGAAGKEYKQRQSLEQECYDGVV